MLLLFCRVTGVMALAPLMGSERVPGRLKAALAVMVAAVLAPAAGPPGGGPDLAGPITVGLAAAGELLIGLAIGFAAKLVFAAVTMAGELADIQAGFGFAGVVSPQSGEQVSVIGQLQMIVSWLIFLGANGHHLVLQGLAASLTAVPLGSGPGLCAPALTHATAGLIAAALRIAAPVVASVLLADLALGLLTRAAPQMNLLAIGFPVKVAVGLWVAMLALPVLGAAERGLLSVMQGVLISVLRELRLHGG